MVDIDYIEKLAAVMRRHGISHAQVGELVLNLGPSPRQEQQEQYDFRDPPETADPLKDPATFIGGGLPSWKRV